MTKRTWNLKMDTDSTNHDPESSSISCSSGAPSEPGIKPEEADRDQSMDSLRGPAGNQCHKCGRIFHSVSALKGHIAVEHNGLKHTCHICGSMMKWAGNFLTHMRVMHKLGEPPVTKNKNRKCQHCGIVFPSNKRLYQHMRTMHRESKPVPCPHCSETFRYENALYWHKFDHVETVTFKCSECMWRFRTKTMLAKHVKTTGHEQQEMSLSNKDDVCKACNKTFNTYYSFRYHCKFLCPALSLSQASEQVCVCDICDKTFKSKASFKHHERSMHGNESHPCEICNKEFRTAANLRCHSIIHRDVKDKECDLCDYKCFTNGDLKKHRRRHTDEKPYKCRFCDIMFRNSSTRCDHENVKHPATEGKLYKCKKCQKSFERDMTRRKHQNNCQRTFTCQFCSKSLSARNCLLRHEKICCNKEHKPLADGTSDEQPQEGSIDTGEEEKVQSPSTLSSPTKGSADVEDNLSSCGDTPGVELMVHEADICNGKDTGNNGIEYEIPGEKMVVLVYKCPICKQKHYTDKDFRIHLKTEHNAGLKA